MINLNSPEMIKLNSTSFNFMIEKSLHDKNAAKYIAMCVIILN